MKTFTFLLLLLLSSISYSQLTKSIYFNADAADYSDNKRPMSLTKEMEPGEHNVTFDAGNLPSGIYFYNIKAGDYTQTHKMILMK